MSRYLLCALICLGMVSVVRSEPTTIVFLSHDVPYIDAGTVMKWLGEKETMTITLTVNGKAVSLPMRSIPLSVLFDETATAPLNNDAWIYSNEWARVFAPLPLLAQAWGATYSLDTKTGTILIRHPRCPAPLEGMVYVIDAKFPAMVKQSERKAKEASLIARQMTIRSALEEYRKDNGHYPELLQELTSDVLKLNYAWKGPYLLPKGGIGNTGMPFNPFADSTDEDLTHHWRYNPKTGEVLPNDLMHRAPEKPPAKP